LIVAIKNRRLNMTKLWKARESVVRVANAVSVVTTALLDTTVSSGSIEGKIKNLTIAVPEGAVDQQNFLGVTSGFQNSALEDKPYGLATISGTMVWDSDEILETWYGGAGTTITTNWTRYQYGDSTTGKKRIAAAFLVNLDDGTDEVTALLNNALITKLGDKKIGGPDGHWEQVRLHYN
jgi:hypothetical protein